MRFLTRCAAGAAFLLPGVVFAADEPAPVVAPQGSTLPASGEAPPAAPTADSGTPPVAPDAASDTPQVLPELPAAQIDDAARVLLQQISDTYKNLKTYADTMETTVAGARAKPITVKVQMAFERPDKALVKRTDDQGTAIFAVDGKSFFVSIPQVKDKYLKRALPPQLSFSAGLAFKQASGVGPGLGFWISGQDLVKETTGALVSLKVGNAAQINGVTTDTLVATLHDESAEVIYTFFAGHDDHLIRRVTMEQTGQDRSGKEVKISGVEEHINVQADAMLVPSLLKFTPPTGAKASESLEVPRYDARLKPGFTPMKFMAKDLAGKAISLDQYKGKVVLLDFWATWCKPCMIEMPNIIATYKKYHAKGFDIVGVSLDDEKEALTGFLKEAKIPWRQTFDGKNFTGAIPKLYQVTAIPFSMVIGRDGKIAAMDTRGPALDAAVQKALAAPSAKMPAKSTKKKSAKNVTESNRKLCKKRRPILCRAAFFV